MQMKNSKVALIYYWPSSFKKAHPKWNKKTEKYIRLTLPSQRSLQSKERNIFASIKTTGVRSKNTEYTASKSMHSKLNF